MKPKYRNIFLLFGITAIVVMLYKFDFKFDILKTIKWWWLIAVIGIWVFVYLLNAAAFYLIVNNRNFEGKHLPYAYAYKFTVSGFAFSYATPFGFGGGPYRMMELNSFVGTRKAASSVTLYSMMHILSHICLWATAVILFIVLYPVKPYLWTLFAIFALVCSIIVFFFYKGYKNGLVVKLFTILKHIPIAKRWMKPFCMRNEEALVQIDEQIASLHEHGRRFYGALSLEYLARVINSFEYFFILLALGYQISFDDSLLILAFSSLIGNLLFFFPMQLGAREGSLAMILKELSIQHPGVFVNASSIGIAASLLTRIRELVWIIIGVSLVKLGNNKDKTKNGFIKDQGNHI